MGQKYEQLSLEDRRKIAGLSATVQISVPLICEAIGNVEYRLVRQIPFDDELDLFVGEAVATHMRKGAMEGELFREDADPLLYMGTRYDSGGQSMGKFYTHLGKIERADYDSPLLKKYLGPKKPR